MWVPLLVGAVACYLFKLAGLSLPERLLEHPLVRRLAALLPVALLAALAALQTITSGQSLVLDARAAGVAVGAVAIWRRAPFLVVVGVAALTAALIRVIGG